MRKFVLLFIFIESTFTGLNLNGQTRDNAGCDKNSLKVSFNGVAPSPWAIDGNINDWITLLGGPSGDPDFPFHPPVENAFNWALDRPGMWEVPGTHDVAPPSSEIQFLSFIHDDYNVFFYFRRLHNGSSPNTFYYFIDVSGDGWLNFGEPVFHAQFTNNTISSLKLSVYVPKLTSGYWAGHGNRMLPPPNIDPRFDWNPTNDSTYNQYTQGVAGYPIPGTLVELFNSNNIPRFTKLQRHEKFAAALTENGFGVELAIPWRYLRNWLSLKRSLNPGEIFFYKLSMKTGGGYYNPAQVVDNAGSCCGSLGKSGNVKFTNNGMTTAAIVPGFSYRSKFSYTNLTNALLSFDIERVHLNNIQLPPGETINARNITLTIYEDKNCNGIIDPGEPGIPHYTISNTVSNGGSISFTFYDGPTGPNTRYANATAPGYGRGCFIADINFPTPGITGANIVFNPSVLFKLPWEYCDGAGGKVINNVGVVGGDLGSPPPPTTKIDGVILDENYSSNKNQVYIYPNPAKSSTNVILPENAGGVDIILQDNYGRPIKRMKNFKLNRIQLDNLKPGIYMLNILFRKTRQQVTKKIVVLK